MRLCVCLKMMDKIMIENHLLNNLYVKMKTIQYKLILLECAAQDVVRRY